MKKQDIILIIFSLAISAILYSFFWDGAEAGSSAVITLDGNVLIELPLDENTNFTVEQEDDYNVIEIKDSYVIVRDASCPDQICVEHRKVHLVGETIVCLPHKLVVEIRGDAPAAEFDAVVN
jgi:Uncharacterized protein conserved in bacteria